MVRYLTKVEAHRLLGELLDHLRDMVEFSLNTELRQSNVTGLKWAAIDLGRRMIVINAEDLKNGNDHGVPLNDTAVEIIQTPNRKTPNACFHLQRRTHNTMQYQNIQKRLKKSRDKRVQMA